MPNQPNPAANTGQLLLGALIIADDRARRAVGMVLERFYHYDHENLCYIPRGRVSAEEMRRTIEEALSRA